MVGLRKLNSINLDKRMHNYTEEEIKDVKNREAQALKVLGELFLTPAISMQAVNIGNDTFAMKPIPYLSDTKYGQSSIKSPDEFLPPQTA